MTIPDPPPKEMLFYEIHCTRQGCPYSVMHTDFTLKKIKDHHKRWNSGMVDHKGRPIRHQHKLIFRKITKEEAQYSPPKRVA